MRLIERRKSFVCLAAVGLCFGPMAAFSGAFGVVPYVEIAGEYDTNVFREEDDDSVAGTTQSSAQDDTLTRGTLGAAAEWPIARQRLIVGGQVSEVRYDRFDQLDHSEHEARAALEFKAGSAIAGRLSYLRERRLDDFDNIDSGQPNFVTVNNPQVEVVVDVTPSWRVRTQAGHLRLDQSLDSQENFELRENRVTLEVQHLGNPGSILGAGVEVIDGEYPGRDSTSALSPEFTQQTAFFSADWRYSGVSTFRGRLGYTRRDNSGGGDRDFNGVTGELAYVREISGKTTAVLQVFRQIYSVDNVDANFLREVGGQVQLRWAYSPNLGANVIYRHAEQDYESLPGFSDSRKDIRDELTAELVFQPFRVMSFIFNLTAESRDSNQPGESFEDLRGGLALRLSLDTD